MSDAAANDLLAYLHGQRDALVEFLRDLTLAESPSSVPQSQRHVRRVLGSALRDLQFETRVAGKSPGPEHLYARPRSRQRGHPAQLLLGHYDTVWPLGTLREMPFAVDGDIIRGPGVFDMKGGLAQMVFAFRALAATGREPALTPVIFVNADEEIGSRTSARYIRLLARRARRALVLEPSLGPSGRLKTRRKGVGRFTITVHGEAAHAGLDPESGASAILELSFVIQRLFALNDPSRGISVNVGTVDGGIRPNVIAPHSQAVIDVRVAEVADGERIEQTILALEPTTPGVRLHIEGGIGRPVMEATARNRRLWTLARRLGNQLGLDLGEGLAGGGSDGSTASLYTATLDGLGAVGDGAHARHEFLHLGRTIERAALLALLLAAPDEGKSDG